MKLMFLGAPGAGKGTQAEVVSERYQIPAISTGALLREAMANGTELGKKAKGYIDGGALVPDDVVIGIIKERLAADDCSGGFILDGFPRTVAQAIALDEMEIKMDGVISIEVADEAIIRRLGGRRLCAKCGSSYHVDYKPTAVAGVCDKCQGELITRADDKPEVIKSRLDIYHEQTEPLKDFYAAKGILKTVIGQEEIEDTTALTIAAVESIRG
ncbi:MAG: adenylate kinase [Clostridia bacterium]|nr:adenylate kinase [Clostridia bacterium]